MYILTESEKKQYATLSRKVDEARVKVTTLGPSNYNSRLKTMQAFLAGLKGDFSNNRYMRANPID